MIDANSYVVTFVIAALVILLGVAIHYAASHRNAAPLSAPPTLSPETIDLIRRAYGLICDAGLSSYALTRQRRIDGRLLTWTGGNDDVRAALRRHPPVPGLPGVRYAVTDDRVSFMFGSTFATLWPDLSLQQKART